MVCHVQITTSPPHPRLAGTVDLTYLHACTHTINLSLPRAHTGLDPQQKQIIGVELCVSISLVCVCVRLFLLSVSLSSPLCFFFYLSLSFSLFALFLSLSLCLNPSISLFSLCLSVSLSFFLASSLLSGY